MYEESFSVKDGVRSKAEKLNYVSQSGERALKEKNECESQKRRSTPLNLPHSNKGDNILLASVSTEKTT